MEINQMKYIKGILQMIALESNIQYLVHAADSILSSGP